MPTSKHVPDEIRNSIFLPLMKKALMGGRKNVRPSGAILPLMNYFYPSPLTIESGSNEKKSCTRLCSL